MTEAGVLARRLLPSGATPFERAHLAAQIAAWPLDVAAIARQSDPDTCDPALLPFLFFDRGGIVWSDAWPEAKRRQVVRGLFTYKRLEGTPRGLEAYLNLAGALVLRETLPLARCFAIPDTGGLDHAAIARLMPQVRLYHRWPAAHRPRAAFAGAAARRGRFAIPDVVGPRGRYPVLWDRGVETPPGVADAGAATGTVTLTAPGTKGSAAYAGRAFAGASCLGRPAGGRAITFALLDPEVVPVRVPDPLNRAVAAAGRGCARATFARSDDAGAGDYDRLILNDPSRVPAGGGAKASAAAFAGETWIGLRPHHVLLKAAVPGDHAVPRRRLFAGQAFALPQANRALRFAMQAANAARRAGDRVLVELSPTAQGGRINPLPDLDPEPAP